ncbi:glycosyltransferase [bacterium]|nr:glycosyltransferase [bacterium]
MNTDRLSVVVCIPVFNDAKSAALLLEQIEAVAGSLPYDFAVVFVDDGSRHEEFAALPGPTPHIPAVEVLRLRRNLGHQRAIAIGLSFIAAETDADYAVVMDGDGEDCPSSLPELLAAAEAAPHAAVFAERLKRHDGAGFMLGYRVFRLLHKLFVGRDVKVGNFSVLPRPVLERVVGVSEIWNHYAAGVFHARIPVVQVPIARGRRLAGESKMNLPSLVMHGICALSVWSDVIVSRLFVIVAGLMAAVVAALGAVLTIRLFTTAAIPGWATFTAGMLVIGGLLLGIVSLLLAVFVLGNRSAANFLPHRDWRDYVLPEDHASVAGHAPLATK